MLPPEECDDGNLVDGDNCSATCVSEASPLCGDGIVQSQLGEVCDDGNATNSDGCNADCLPTTVLQIASGDDHTCALLNTREVRCWGSNDLGQLGLGHTDNIGDNEAPNGPVVALGAEALQLTAGRKHTCALLSGGDVRCWGDASLGQLGYGNTNTIGDDETPDSQPPVSLGGAVSFLDASGEHTCALLNNGDVRCWGFSFRGVLGYGDNESIGNDEVPSSVLPVNVGGGVILLAAGATHNCALFLNGDVRCWGFGATGALGYGNTDDLGDNETPASQPPLSLGGAAITIAAGGHNCAILETQTMRCWGLNDFGQLGLGNTDTLGDDEIPTAVADITFPVAPTQLAVGLGHTCASFFGELQCWGKGEQGQLGYGNTNNLGDDETIAALPALELRTGVLQVTAGAEHTCALFEGGEVRCWGRNDLGQLGLGHTENIGDDELPADQAPVVLF